MPEIFQDLEQNTLEWLRARAGLPTASCFSLVQAKPGPKGGTSHKEYKGRTSYLYKLAGERLTGEPMDNYVSRDMQRGKDLEQEAIDLYAMLKRVEPVRVGFIRNGNCGASPDALIEKDGLLEVKNAAPHVQIERFMGGSEWVKDHLPQCQGQLNVSLRRWVDLMSYCPGMKPIIVRIERDEKYIATQRVDVDAFVRELENTVELVRRGM